MFIGSQSHSKLTVSSLLPISDVTRNFTLGGGLKPMASAEREAITGSGGKAPSGVQGQSPWSGGQGAKPPEAESFFVDVHP